MDPSNDLEFRYNKCLQEIERCEKQCQAFIQMYGNTTPLPESHTKPLEEAQAIRQLLEPKRVAPSLNCNVSYIDTEHLRNKLNDCDAYGAKNYMAKSQNGLHVDGFNTYANDICADDILGYLATATIKHGFKNTLNNINNISNYCINSQFVRDLHEKFQDTTITCYNYPCNKVYILKDIIEKSLNIDSYNLSNSSLWHSPSINTSLKLYENRSDNKIYKHVSCRFSVSSDTMYRGQSNLNNILIYHLDDISALRELNCLTGNPNNYYDEEITKYSNEAQPKNLCASFIATKKQNFINSFEERYGGLKKDPTVKKVLFINNTYDQSNDKDNYLNLKDSVIQDQLINMMKYLNADYCLDLKSIAHHDLLGTISTMLFLLPHSTIGSR